jgi:hypothetical protein
MNVGLTTLGVSQQKYLVVSATIDGRIAFVQRICRFRVRRLHVTGGHYRGFNGGADVSMVNTDLVPSLRIFGAITGIGKLFNKSAA